MFKAIHISCPHLGLKHDPSTSYFYPSCGHICHHAKGLSTPKLGYQQSTCLTPDYFHCPIYNSPVEIKMPKSMREPKVRQKRNYQAWFTILLIIVIILAVVASLIFHETLFFHFSRVLIPARQQTQRAEPISLFIIPTTEITPSLTQTPTATVTLAPTSTATSTPTPPQPTPSPTITGEPAVLALNTPIGQNVKFIILRVNAGEALGQFANRYNTTEDAIRGVNFKLPSVLYVDRILVIPMDVTDISGFPAFEAYQIRRESILVEALAEQLAVAPDDLYMYNDIQPGRVLTPGEWILVPRE